MDERGVPLTQRNDGGVVADRKEIAIARDDSPALFKFHWLGALWPQRCVAVPREQEAKRLDTARRPQRFNVADMLAKSARISFL